MTIKTALMAAKDFEQMKEEWGSGMAYSRWSYSDWYIYWHAGTTGDEPMLVVWNANVDIHSLPDPYLRSEIIEMLETDDLSRIPGYTPEDHNYLRRILKEWLDDIERYTQGSGDLISVNPLLDAHPAGEPEI